MGYLRSVTIYADSCDFPFGRAPRCVEHHFARHLRGCKVPGVTQINLQLSGSEPHGTTQQFGTILDYYGQVDMSMFGPQMSTYDKKKFFMDALVLNLKDLFSAQGWDYSTIAKAYDKCLKESLKNDWFFKHKLFPSPNGEYRFGLLNRFGLDTFEIVEVLFDAHKTELARRRVFVDKNDSFHITWASWEGSDREFSYRFDGPRKVFTCRIRELLEGIERPIPTNVSEYFK